MKENKELERHDIAIDREMEVDCDIGQEITVYIETWFDVDKKFGTQLNGNDSAWLNLYGKYNPYEDTLRIECEIDADDGQPNQWFDYEPTEGEAMLDHVQAEMSTARQFLFILRCKGMKPEQIFQTANRTEKVISEQGFEVRRMKKADIKRFLAIYFGASMNGDQMPDVDGEQFYEVEDDEEEN